MSPERAQQRYNDFLEALARLNESLNEDITISSTIIDGVIQRFEFTFELAWKLMKDVLGYSGIDAKNPRSVIKEAYQQQWISDGDGWLDLLDDRNKTTHIYDQTEAKRIYNKIKSDYAQLFEALALKMADELKKF